MKQYILYSTYIDFDFENSDKDAEFKVGDHVSISKYKNIFAKECTKNWSKKSFWVKMLRTLYHGHISQG